MASQHRSSKCVRLGGTCFHVGLSLVPGLDDFNFQLFHGCDELLKGFNSGSLPLKNSCGILVDVVEWLTLQYGVKMATNNDIHKHQSTLFSNAHQPSQWLSLLRMLALNVIPSTVRPSAIRESWKIGVFPGHQWPPNEQEIGVHDDLSFAPRHRS